MVQPRAVADVPVLTAVVAEIGSVDRLVAATPIAASRVAVAIAVAILAVALVPAATRPDAPTEGPISRPDQTQ